MIKAWKIFEVLMNRNCAKCFESAPEKVEISEAGLHIGGQHVA